MSASRSAPTGPRTTFASFWRLVVAACLYIFALPGCEVRSLYGIELVDFDEARPWQVIEKSNYSVYVAVAASPDAPGMTLVAISNDAPAGPQWDWEEYESWSPGKKASMFSSFYDQKYFDLRVSHTSTCMLTAEGFEHRESAEEAAYGQWLHDLPSDIIGLHPKGVSIRAPVANCDGRSKSPAGDIEELTISVDGGIVDEDQQLQVRFRVYLVDKAIHWLL
jgi:hypothetical protein